MQMAQLKTLINTVITETRITNNVVQYGERQGFLVDFSYYICCFEMAFLGGLQQRKIAYEIKI